MSQQKEDSDSTGWHPEAPASASALTPSSSSSSADSGPSSSSSSSSSAEAAAAAAAAAAAHHPRLLFVEVRGPRGNNNARRQGLQYGRSTRELKSHVMRVTSEDKRQQLLLRQGSSSSSSSGGGGGGGGDNEGDDDDRQKRRRAKALAAAVVVRRAAGNNSLLPEPSPGLVDPFDMLPIGGSPELHASIKYYFENYPGPTPLTDDALVCHNNAAGRDKVRWLQEQFKFCQEEKIVYQMLLFIWQGMRTMSKGDMDFQALKYWTKALQMTREAMPIGKTGLDIPESYVAMVGGHAIAATWLGDFANSAQHRGAMLRLVEQRGGLATFGFMAQRVLKWCEYYACAGLGVAPGLPRLPMEPLPPDLVRRANAAHRRTVALLPPPLAADPDAPLSLILFQLHAATLGTMAVPAPGFASVMDDIEHRILVELEAKTERFAAAAAAAAASAEAEAERGTAAAVAIMDPMDLVEGALLQAIQICVFRRMTFTRKEMPLYGLFVATMRHMLDDQWPSSRVVDVWRTVASVESLLWVLFVGWAAASQLRGDATGAIEDARWITRQLFVVFDILVLREEEDLLEELRQFPWNEESFRGPCEVLWSVFVNRRELNIT